MLLLPNAVYEIVSIGGQIIGEATGGDVMALGVELDGREADAQVLFLTPRDP